MSVPSVKNLHIMTDTNFQVTGSFIRMINESSEAGKHLFLMDESHFTMPEDIRSLENTLTVKNLGSSSEGIRTLIAYCDAAENIFWHSLGWHWKLQKKLLGHKNITDKSVWISWGNDLYNFVKKGKSFPEKIYRNYTKRIMLSFRKRMKAGCVIFPKDKDAMEKILGPDKKIYVSRYTTFTKEDLENAKPKEDAAIAKPLTIMVGHAAAPVLDHFNVLDALAAYKNENIRVIVPLSYGEKAYGDSVAAYAKDIFGDKAEIIREMMSPEDYTRLLWGVDMAVFHTDRQIALGNICRLLYMCCKIYTKKGGALWEELAGSGCVLYDSGDVGKLPLGALADRKDLESSGNRAFAEDSMDPDKTFEMWLKVFKDVDGK